MTRVVRFHELGGPEVLRIEQAEVRLPGPGEIRMAVKALGLSAGHALEAVAVSGGWLLMASGKAICFIADEATRTHIHSREITSHQGAAQEYVA